MIQAPDVAVKHQSKSQWLSLSTLSRERPGTCCRYLYRHNYTVSVPEVYYEINRPDLHALYTDQLLQRDFSRQGSTDTWVQYLTKGKGSP